MVNSINPLAPTLVGPAAATQAPRAGVSSPVGTAVESTYESSPAAPSSAASSTNPPVVADFAAPQNAVADGAAAKIAWLSDSPSVNGMGFELGQIKRSDTIDAQNNDEVRIDFSEDIDRTLAKADDDPRVLAASQKLIAEAQNASHNGAGDPNSALAAQLSSSLGISSQQAAQLIGEMAQGGDVAETVATAIVVHDSNQGSGVGAVSNLHLSDDALSASKTVLAQGATILQQSPQRPGSFGS